MDLINRNRERIMEVYVKRAQEMGLTAPDMTGLDFVGRVSTTTPVTREAIMSKIIEGVNEQILPNEQILREPTLITVEPMLMRNHCHVNCEIMLAELNQNGETDFERHVGYNVTACKCGGCLTMELHSVLFHVPSETFIDLTTDMYGELTKWFVPLNFDGKSFEEQKAFVGRIGEERYSYLYTWKGTHHCQEGVDSGAVWAPQPQYPSGREEVYDALEAIDCWMYENDVVPADSDPE
jgi:hypothetical protein